jgi:hypothetical protein
MPQVEASILPTKVAELAEVATNPLNVPTHQGSFAKIADPGRCAFQPDKKRSQPEHQQQHPDAMHG